MDRGEQPAPGWYPDPQGGPFPAERWWDGSTWSASTRAVAQQPQGAWGATPAAYAPRPASPLDLATGTTSDERTWAILAHLSALIGAVVGPLVVFLVKRDESPFVRAHAAAALNFHITWLLGTFVVAAVGGVFSIVTLGFGLVLLFPVLVAIAVASFVFVVLATIKAGRGEAPTPSTYPLSFTFVR